ncbi:MAG: carbon-nitrogen hydrolase family protein [Oscillospiraceae bacterium]|nr:carbon-nitrogen hydrolase family protein [Oscillospiraceae bacterium]
MKIAAAQLRMSEDMEQNFQKSIELMKRAKEQGADLILYPEIQMSPFFPQYRKANADKYLISAENRYFKEFCKACKANKIMASPNFYFKENGKKYDMSFLIDSGGGVIGSQKMVHIAQAENFYEQDYYTPSNDGFNVFRTTFGNIAIVVCFDRHYPESIRTAALKGADLILIPTANIVGEPEEMFEWEIRVQAFQNSVPIVMCNRVGKEGNIKFSGQSIWIDANGNTVRKLGAEETLEIAELDISATDEIRKSRPYTSLRRKELYI